MLLALMLPQHPKGRDKRGGRRGGREREGGESENSRLYSGSSVAAKQRKDKQEYRLTERGYNTSKEWRKGKPLRSQCPPSLSLSG